MKHTPCEYIVWNGLPIIRKEIAVSMINDYGLSQNESAEKLGISPAAVSQYLSGKRGKMKVVDKEVYKEINISAERIIQQEDEILVSESCRLCKIFTSKNLFPLGNRRETCEIL
jgi:predicted transcriptional regulator